MSDHTWTARGDVFCCVVCHEAFPEDMGGLYVPEEMAQASNGRAVTVESFDPDTGEVPQVDLLEEQLQDSIDHVAEQSKAFEVTPSKSARFLAWHYSAPCTLTFAHIAVEEMSAAICAPDDVARRAELVQLAAVCVQWIEAIDRRGK